MKSPPIGECFEPVLTVDGVDATRRPGTAREQRNYIVTTKRIQYYTATELNKKICFIYTLFSKLNLAQ